MTSTTTQSPGLATMQSLLDAVRSSKAIRGSDAVLYCLAWLTVSRLLIRGDITRFRQLPDLLLQECWISAVDAGLPEAAMSVVWTDAKDGRSEEAFKVKILAITAEFAGQPETGEESLGVSIADQFLASNIHQFGVSRYDPGLCDLLIGLLDGGQGDLLWIPFDPTGQLSVRALFRGYYVLAAGPLSDVWTETALRLLALIDNTHARLTTDIQKNPSSPAHIEMPNIEYLVACPPLGMRVPLQTGWRRWEGSKLDLAGSDAVYKKIGSQTSVQLDRAESWTIAAFWPHVKKRAVFLTTPNLLFSKGQEQRLRELLVIGARQPVAVVSLPPKVITNTGIVSAALVMDRNRRNDSLRMVDASKLTLESKSTMKFSRLLDVQRVLKLIASPVAEDVTAKDILLDEVADQECNLMPNRYLLAHAVDDGERIALGELVQSIVRAPIATKDATAITVQEIGIVDLGQWSRLTGPFTKTTTVQAKKLSDYVLAEDDILVSVKGTLGKVGLLSPVRCGEGNGQSQAVCSQSCIALRVNKQQVNVLALYLYLCSEDFRSQLDALRVGVSVSHITPSNLLQDIKVPRQKLLSAREAEEIFSELCRLEAEVLQAHERIDEIRRCL
ncbi:N-6 DNA methylase [Noviherbaspirillum sp. 1P10PC]|uniref:N-6 DNA methylase n=1 Tax=Noviherbaspirillum sp. 1P10PC TaxID=3132292 RepID=UPI0039A006EB